MATIATTGTAADVQAKINAAADPAGDTLTIPPNVDITWATKVTVPITKKIKLLGLGGIGSTIIRDGVQSGRMLDWTLAPNWVSDCSGIDFRDGGRTQGISEPEGNIGFNGSNINGSQLRLHHCGLDQLNGTVCFNTCIGVVDHNTVTALYAMFSIRCEHWNGDSEGQGDVSWRDVVNWGSSEFLFIEDNTVVEAPVMAQAGITRGLTDAVAGARFVARYNNLTNMAIQSHGTDSTGRTRGVRACEWYNNNFATAGNVFPGGFLGQIRSGVVLMHHNTIAGFGAAALNLAVYRMDSSAFVPWGGAVGACGADGNNVWDVNHTGKPFFSGTAASNSSQTTIGGDPNWFTVTVSGSPGWTTDQWRGYTAKRIGGTVGLGDFAEILANGSNTITWRGHDTQDFGANLAFTTGQSIQFWKVDHALDQPGRAGGSLISGGPPTVPPGWNDQVTDPCYSWANTREGGAAVNFSINNAVIRINEHYFNDTPKPGYTPYIYPHPLVSGGAAPTAPTITSANSTTFSYGASSSFQVTASGSPVITYSKTSGSFPTGASMSSAGLISGAPTQLGDFTFSIRATNGTAPDSTQNFTLHVVDATAPTCTITSPTAGATVSGTISVTATATDNVAAVGVQFKLDGVNLGSEDVASPYSISWNTTTATNGTHSLTAVARDAAENTTTSAPVVVTVNNDAVAPMVSITSPVASSVQSGTISVTATASDNVAVVGVQFKCDGVNIGSEDTASPYSASLDTTALTNASHVLTAVARDAAGNTTTSASVTFTVNNAVPSVSPSITSASSCQFVLNNAGSFQVHATGDSPMTFSKTGTLPTGTSFGSDGLLSGTPTQTGSFPISITATNGVSPDATQAFSISVVTAGGKGHKKRRALGRRR